MTPEEHEDLRRRMEVALRQEPPQRHYPFDDGPATVGCIEAAAVVLEELVEEERAISTTVLEAYAAGTIADRRTLLDRIAELEAQLE